MKTINCTVYLFALFSVLALNASAQGEDYIYTKAGSAVTITGYTGAGGDLVIPSVIDGLPVTTIGVNAFAGNELITSVVVPNTVVEIDNFAFIFCQNMTNVVLSDSLTRIGKYAFGDCYALTEAICIEIEEVMRKGEMSLRTSAK